MLRRIYRCNCMEFALILSPRQLGGRETVHLDPTNAKLCSKANCDAKERILHGHVALHTKRSEQLKPSLPRTISCPNGADTRSQMQIDASLMRARVGRCAWSTSKPFSRLPFTRHIHHTNRSE